MQSVTIRCVHCLHWSMSFCWQRINKFNCVYLLSAEYAWYMVLQKDTHLTHSWAIFLLYAYPGFKISLTFSPRLGLSGPFYLSVRPSDCLSDCLFLFLVILCN